MTDTTTYLHLKPDSALPAIADVPTRMVVIFTAKVSTEWQAAVSRWIVQSGCLYMMAWGLDCSSWDDSVDSANIDEYEGASIPEDKFVVTTWHSEEPLAEVFWFAKNAAHHPVMELDRTVILDISTESRREQLLEAFAAA